jgi:DNA-binding MarR family transcriptional regulator
MGTDRTEHAAMVGAFHEAMRRLTNQITFYSEAVAARLGMHPTDLDCLSAIALEDDVTAGRLAEITGLTTGAVTGVIDRLERAGYVKRVPDPNDRRRVVVEPIPEALTQTGAAFAPMLESSAAMLARYNTDELAMLTDYVTRSVPILREETLRLRDSADPEGAPDEVVLTGTGARNATLRFARGAARLTVIAVAQSQLFEATFSGSTPNTGTDHGAEGDVVTVQYRRSPFGFFRTRGRITLDASRSWNVEVNGGMAHCVLDLSVTDVRALTIEGGVASVEIALPQPRGVLPVTVRGGVHAVTITRPEGSGASVTINGGVANLVLDDERYGAIGGRSTLRSSSYEGAPDCVEVSVRGGASSLSIVAERSR